MQGRSINITWSQFEICNADTRIAFENMCRMLFNNFFFDGKPYCLVPQNFLIRSTVQYDRLF